ncbi:hypothetical protein HOO65_011330 [Ceratocystis lukuohia]|uniref:Uncharacterized protein n=1 Tax=Ceratocystis lukuohia TaxID=2019550 RepID=A0ABR4MUK1_9PEZI
MSLQGFRPQASSAPTRTPNFCSSPAPSPPALPRLPASQESPRWMRTIFGARHISKSPLMQKVPCFIKGCERRVVRDGGMYCDGRNVKLPQIGAAPGPRYHRHDTARLIPDAICLTAGFPVLMLRTLRGIASVYILAAVTSEFLKAGVSNMHAVKALVATIGETKRSGPELTAPIIATARLPTTNASALCTNALGRHVLKLASSFILCLARAVPYTHAHRQGVAGSSRSTILSYARSMFANSRAVHLRALAACQVRGRAHTIAILTPA